jgi:putative serine protease PepD
MDPEQDPEGHGDELDDDQPDRAWLHPDDRLWRHPSEVGAGPPAPAPALAGPGRNLLTWAKRAEVRTWFLGVVSGAVGALVCVALLVAAGLVGTQETVLNVQHASTAPSSTATTNGQLGATGVLEQVAPSVVGLSVDGAQGGVTGSGIIVLTTDQYCYVLTDSALFQDAGPSAQIQVEASTGQTKSGFLMGTDSSAGIAVVRVAFTPPAAMSPVNLGSVANVQTGEEIFSIGSPVMGGSANGSYFANGSIIDSSSYLQPVNDATDAMFSMLVANITVDPSAYGGAVVDGSGNVIGITNPVTGALARSGQTYVTPIDVAMADVGPMVKFGHAAPHPWLGVLQANDVAGGGIAHVSSAGAVQVDTVAGGSPAAKAGIADGDFITAVGGKSTSSVGELIAWMADAKPGQVVSVAWVSSTGTHQANVTLGDQPASASPS